MIDFDTGLMILAGIAGLWFTTRFLYRPKGSSGGLGSMFKREVAETVPGIGLEALRSLTDDLTAFTRNETALRGVILAGPFVAKSANAASDVTAILVSNDLAGQDEAAYLRRWPYIRRGHDIRDQRLERVPGGIIHHLVLRGAPPVVLTFIKGEAAMPPQLEPALKQGATFIDIGTGDAEALLARWNIRATKRGEKT
ncbi:MAG: hypothetical protein MUF11_12665 [Beijerinckiaceae bacterium]|jgi:hypothetical protein|nr:hypothetical protein [Beijerinckiaceae bacterium]